ncbi:hypothetical protein FIBSPDRAFT_951136 [Athelia psychrophila]|uniref:Uncharacterized protein n=1 Tax=Athelia psychrophila TaxID=1759441 RepID=A0A166MVL2_9AGAM|nr:hypothetical protein FIBSPDRAFT_951136 [Fibularhizoctonia sp. CBS 109695]
MDNGNEQPVPPGGHPVAPATFQPADNWSPDITAAATSIYDQVFAQVHENLIQAFGAEVQRLKDSNTEIAAAYSALQVPVAQCSSAPRNLAYPPSRPPPACSLDLTLETAAAPNALLPRSAASACHSTPLSRQLELLQDKQPVLYGLAKQLSPHETDVQLVRAAAVVVIGAKLRQVLV